MKINVEKMIRVAASCDTKEPNHAGYWTCSISENEGDFWYLYYGMYDHRTSVKIPLKMLKEFIEVATAVLAEYEAQVKLRGES